MRSNALRPVFTVLVAIGLVMSACTAQQAPESTEEATPEGTGEGAPEETAAPESGELRVASASWGNEALDPAQSISNNGTYLRLMFDSIVGVDPTGTEISKETGIAEDWTVSEDFRTYTLAIRQGVTFHDGTELTAEDVKFTLDRLREGGGLDPFASQLTANEYEVTTNGDFEVEIQLGNPMPNLINLMSPLLSGASNLVVPQHYVEEVGAEAFGEEPMGTGPYRLVERQAGTSMTFEAAIPDHFAGAPRFERVTMRLIPEESTRLAMLRSDEVDFIDVGIEAIPSLESDGFKIFAHSAPDPLYLFFQLQRPDELTQDANLRQALSLAINREEINEALMGGHGEVTGNLFPAQIGGEPIDPVPYDLDMAKELLGRTPYGPEGEPLVVSLQVSIREGWPQMLTIATAIQGYWDELGVESEIVYRDYAAFSEALTAQALPNPSAILLNIPGRTDWRGISFFRCDRPLTSVCSPENEEFWQAWNAATSPEEEQAAARATEEYMLENQLVSTVVAYGVRFAGNDLVPDDFSAGVMPGQVNLKSLAQSQ